ncbi:ATP-binding cassette domain-containing protein [Saccharopolyspora sp. NPDC002376]
MSTGTVLRSAASDQTCERNRATRNCCGRRPRWSRRPAARSGRWAAPLESRRRIGYLPQEFGYYPRFTAREFVEHFAWLKEVPAAELPLAVDRALIRVGLADRADEKLKRLSGGMRRRVGIAQAIVNDPELLLLDEPTAGLDPEQQVEFRELLRELGQDRCVVLSTHVLGDAGACDQLWVLDSGQPVFRGAPDELGSGSLEESYHAVLRANRKSAA